MSTFSEFDCATAAFHGDIKTLKDLRSKGCPWDIITCSNAAASGCLYVLQWARENGCPWDHLTCALAAAYNQFHILKWARENGCPWDVLTCANAALNGNFELLQWAIENGCPYNIEVVKTNLHNYKFCKWAINLNKFKISPHTIVWINEIDKLMDINLFIPEINALIKSYI